MARPYRWLGGIGYILELVPYIGLISPILVAAAWILMGRDTGERVFTILGILIIMTCSLAIAFAAWLALPLIWPLAPWGMGGAHGIPAQLLGIIVVVVILLLAGLATASFILDIIAHFRAGRIFNSRWFRAAGWARIILALTAVIAFMAFVTISAAPGPPPVTPLLEPYAAFAPLLALFWPLAIALMIGLIAIIFSIVAFFTIPGEATPAPS